MATFLKKYNITYSIEKDIPDMVYSRGTIKVQVSKPNIDPMYCMQTICLEEELKQLTKLETVILHEANQYTYSHQMQKINKGYNPITGMKIKISGSTYNSLVYKFLPLHHTRIETFDQAELSDNPAVISKIQEAVKQYTINNTISNILANDLTNNCVRAYNTVVSMQVGKAIAYLNAMAKNLPSDEHLYFQSRRIKGTLSCEHAYAEQIHKTFILKKNTRTKTVCSECINNNVIGITLGGICKPFQTEIDILDEKYKELINKTEESILNNLNSKYYNLKTGELLRDKVLADVIKFN